MCIFVLCTLYHSILCTVHTLPVHLECFTHVTCASCVLFCAHYPEQTVYCTYSTCTFCVLYTLYLCILCTVHTIPVHSVYCTYSTCTSCVLYTLYLCILCTVQGSCTSSVQTLALRVILDTLINQIHYVNLPPFYLHYLGTIKKITTHPAKWEIKNNLLPRTLGNPWLSKILLTFM